ncbi:branched-chain amino acid ABC transporter permease [Auritidibacter ignavus]|uniref:branched-chain amino acid ABC transporter permease n=1 Tax=Auritidibacter ignavus TaxID=678932 RepID=UPI00109C5CCD|nr:branched-chain amino acid ABC transporter permease [Auritidibacter ignavus]
MELLVQQLFNGLATGGAYCLAAIGLTLVFGVLKIPNLAHGSLYMLGAYLTFFFMTSAGVHYVLAIICAAIVMGLVGVVLERIVFHPLRDSPHTHHMIAAAGAMFFFTALVQQVWGNDFHRVDSPLTGRLTILEAQVTWQRIAVVLVAVVVMIILTWFIKKTAAGQSIEAIEQDRIGASLVGINPNRVSMMTFALAGVLVAIAGGLMAPVSSISPFMGETIMVKVFAIIILGGLGSIPGAIIGGFGLGVAEALSTTYISAAAGEVIAFVLLVVVLAVKPTGLFAHKGAR